MKNNSRKNKNNRYKICPECGEKSFKLIVCKKEVNGVAHFNKYYECICCDYRREYKQKREHKRLEYSDE